MTFSDLKKMTPTAAMELLGSSLQEASNALYPMLIKGTTIDIDQVMDWMALSNLAQAYALSVLQDELDKVGGTAQLRPLANAAIQLYQDAAGMEGPCYSVLDNQYPEAYELTEDMYGRDDDDSDLTDGEGEALDDLLREVREAGLLEDFEDLHITAMDADDEPDLPDDQRMICYDDKVAVYLSAVKKALVAAGHMNEDMVLVLSAGPGSAEGYCDEDDADEFEAVDLNELEAGDAMVVKALIGVLEASGCLREGQHVSIGYCDGDADEDEPDAVAMAAFQTRGGKTLVVFS